MKVQFHLNYINHFLEQHNAGPSLFLPTEHVQREMRRTLEPLAHSWKTSENLMLN